MEAFLVGLFVLLVGLAFTFAGYQFFRILLPLWGLFAGFSWGAEAVAVGLGTGFLTTALGWGFGLVVGLLMAFLAYYFYAAAVGILAGFVGYWLTGGILLSIGFDPGFLVSFTATLAGLALAVVALVMRAPKGLLVVFSAFGGATATIAGFLVMFGQVPIAVLGAGLINTIIFQSFFWTMAWIGLALLGAVTQLQLSQSMMLNEGTYTTTVAGAKGGRGSDVDDDGIVDDTNTPRKDIY